MTERDSPLKPRLSFTGSGENGNTARVVYPAHLAQVCNLATLSADELKAVMEATAVGDVWGVGRKIGAQLVEAGVLTAWDLSRMDPGTVRRRWNVVLERTVRELCGQSCMALEDVLTDKSKSR